MGSGIYHDSKKSAGHSSSNYHVVVPSGDLLARPCYTNHLCSVSAKEAKELSGLLSIAAYRYSGTMFETIVGQGAVNHWCWLPLLHPLLLDHRGFCRSFQYEFPAGPVAPDKVFWPCLCHHRVFGETAAFGKRAAGIGAAAHRNIHRAGDFPLEMDASRFQRLFLGADYGNGREQHLCIGVQRFPEKTSAKAISAPFPITTTRYGDLTPLGFHVKHATHSPVPAIGLQTSTHA